MGSDQPLGAQNGLSIKDTALRVFVLDKFAGVLGRESAICSVGGNVLTSDAGKEPAFLEHLQHAASETCRPRHPHTTSFIDGIRIHEMIPAPPTIMVRLAAARTAPDRPPA